MRRNTDAENGFGEIMPTATVHIRPVRSDDAALKITNYENVGYEVATYSRTMVMTATTDSTVTTAGTISVPASSVVFARVSATYGASAQAGTYGCSGGWIQVSGTFVASGVRVQLQEAVTRTAVGTANAAVVVALSACTAGNIAPITITGIASNKLTWLLDIETTTIIPENNLVAKVNI